VSQVRNLRRRCTILWPGCNFLTCSCPFALYAVSTYGVCLATNNFTTSRSFPLTRGHLLAIRLPSFPSTPSCGYTQHFKLHNILFCHLHLHHRVSTYSFHSPIVNILDLLFIVPSLPYQHGISDTTTALYNPSSYHHDSTCSHYTSNGPHFCSED